MPQTPPFTNLTPRKLTDSELARAIRLSLESEMDAINLYASYIDATDNEAAKRVLDHVMDEEREHAALFWQLIKALDPQQAVHDAEASAKFRLIVAGASHEAVEAAEGDGPRTEPTLDLRQPTVGRMR